MLDRHVDAHADDLAAGAELGEQTIGVLRLRAAHDHERAPEIQEGKLARQVRQGAGAEHDAAPERLVDDGHCGIRRAS